MGLTIASLSCFLVAQLAADAALVPVEPPENGVDQRVSTTDVVAEAFTLPSGTPLAGRPLRLLQALSAAGSTSQQLQVTHAYWRLSEAVAEYRLRWEQCDLLGRIEVGPDDALRMQTARASAAAALRMTEASARSAQHDLAEASMLSPSDPLPLPADLPHVGTYETRFDQVFSLRSPPPRARLIHRSLPICLKAIESRASAARAASDSLETAVDAYRLGRASLGELLLSLDEWGERRRALVECACRYNHDIADYAIPVVRPETDDRVIVAMLIRAADEPREAAAPTGAPGQPARASGAEQPPRGQPATSPSGVERATLNEPVSDSGVEAPLTRQSQGGLQSVGRLMPTLAPPEEQAEPGTTKEQPAARPGGDSEPRSDDGATQTTWRPSAETEPAESEPVEAALAETEPVEAAAAESEPVEAATDEVAVSDEGGEPAEAAPSETPEVPSPTNPSDATPRTVNRPIDQPVTPQPSLGLYPALLDVEHPVRPKLLTEALHERRMLPEPVGDSIELKACLAGSPAANRRDLIAAYWLTAQRAAEYQVLVDRVNWLDPLGQAAFERRHELSGPEAMLQLRAAKLAAEADVLQARLDLLDAQFRLTRLAERALDANWLVPVTLPHAGPYRLKLEAQPRQVAASWAVRRQAAVIPALSESLQDRAEAVVQADAARAAATRAYQSGTQRIASVLAAIECQTQQTLAFLETLTQYNQAIAEYALAVLPPTTPAGQLAGTLVVIR